MGSVAIYFLCVNCYWGWWYQRRLRGVFRNTVLECIKSERGIMTLCPFFGTFIIELQDAIHSTPITDLSYSSVDGIWLVAPT
jgi:hypothetical protein